MQTTAKNSVITELLNDFMERPSVNYFFKEDYADATEAITTHLISHLIYRDEEPKKAEVSNTHVESIKMVLAELDGLLNRLREITPKE